MIAVTGASGLLGGNLVRELLAQAKGRVRALIHQDARADLNDRHSLERAFHGVDVVYHLASLISISMDSWEDVHRINVLGTRNVVEACLKSGVRRLVTSAPKLAGLAVHGIHLGGADADPVYPGGCAKNTRVYDIPPDVGGALYSPRVHLSFLAA